MYQLVFLVFFKEKLFILQHNDFLSFGNKKKSTGQIIANFVKIRDYSVKLVEYFLMRFHLTNEIKGIHYKT